MKKWMYIIFPGIMLAGFLVIYFSHKEESEQRERDHIAAIAAEKAAADEKKKIAEGKAAEESKKRQAERDEAEAKKLADRIAKQAAADKQVRDQTAEFLAKVATFGKEVTDREAELARVRKQREQLNQDTFALAKKVELAAIDRRNAELEIQRKTEMLMRRAEQSAMAKIPTPPAPPAAR